MQDKKLQFSTSEGLKFVRVMKKVIDKADYRGDMLAKEAAKEVLHEYLLTGSVLFSPGINDALYEIIMNYGGLFDGMFAKRILKGRYTKFSSQASLN